jgi:osmotically inducible protein OsmC
MPGGNAAGVTPEEFLAGAWAACFGGAFSMIAGTHGVDAREFRFHTAVTLDSDLEAMRFSISRAELKVEAGNLDDTSFEEILEKAHAICPVSKLFVEGTGSVTVGRAEGLK